VSDLEITKFLSSKKKHSPTINEHLQKMIISLYSDQGITLGVGAVIAFVEA